MPEPEMWDVLDENGDRTGQVCPRGEPGWPPGRFHLIVAVCVVRPDGRVLMTRRAAAKKEFPLTWEFPSGSAFAGETGAAAAARELREETGLSVPSVDLRHVGRYTEPSAHLDMFVAHVAAPDGLTADPQEVDAWEWVSTDEVVARTVAGRLAPPWVDRLERLWPAVLQALPPVPGPLP